VTATATLAEWIMFVLGMAAGFFLGLLFVSLFGPFGAVTMGVPLY
jgi:uncharacterized membrane protein YgaE (UPF0421/DUF939 family)